MKQISDFLKNFNNIFKKDELLKNTIRNSIKKIINIEINRDLILIKNKTIILNEKPHLKNEVFMNKEKILTEINKISNGVVYNNII
jgi:hypothetical protein